jgi:hypothetical protein
MKNFYQLPAVEVLDFKAESGFAVSGPVSGEDSNVEHE